MIDLSNRTCLVTGASSGFGQHFARHLASWGAKVAVAARRTDRLHELVDGIRAGGGSAVAVAMDVTDGASVVAGFDAAEAAIGQIDSVIANAGMSVPRLAIDITAEEFTRVLSTNLTGAFLSVREAARRLKSTGSSGRMIMVSSMGAAKVLERSAAYCASKAGLVMLGKALAKEWALDGINVNSICPGYVHTELTARWVAAEAGKAQIAGFPRHRLMDISDLDGIVAYLLSDQSRAVTGGVFAVDDGQSL